MSTRTNLRTGLAFTAALAALYAGTAALPSADAQEAQGAQGAQGAQKAAPHQTAITFEVPGCEDCEISLVQARWDDSARSGVRVWNGPSATVEDGAATFTVPARRTWGMSVLVDAPWEGQLAAQTTVAFRYGRFGVGDEVSFGQARQRRWAAACWEGTRSDEVTIPLTVRKVRVDGVHGRVDGTIAYASTTQSWLKPMRRAYDGVLASQDVNVCGPRP